MKKIKYLFAFIFIPSIFVSCLTYNNYQQDSLVDHSIDFMYKALDKVQEINSSKKDKFQFYENPDVFKNTEAYKLAKAVKKENTKKISKYLKRKNNLVYVENADHTFNVLEWAIGCNKINAVNVFVDKGVDLNVADSKGNTPLSMACRKYIDIFAKKDVAEKNLEIIRILLQNGADPNFSAEKAKEKSPLMLACNQSVEMVELLVEDGNADINYINEAGESVIQVAIDYSYENQKLSNILYYLIVTKRVDLSVLTEITIDKLKELDCYENIIKGLDRNYSDQSFIIDESIEIELNALKS